MAQKKCPKCNTTFDPEYLFCPECGSKLTLIEEAQIGEADLSVEAPQVSFPGPKTLEGPPQKSSRRFRLLRLARGGGERSEYPVPERGLVIGRIRADITFADDETVSPRHATVKPSGEHLVVEDAGSLNGIFVRIKGEERLEEGDTFICGDQVFRFSLRPSKFNPSDWVFYAAPQEPRVLATVTHILPDGTDGEVHGVRTFPFIIGREEGHALYPNDRFLSRRHAAIEKRDKDFVLVDLKSRNGTYICKRGTLTLGHGDIFMIGRQILRIEMEA